MDEFPNGRIDWINIITGRGEPRTWDYPVSLDCSKGREAALLGENLYRNLPDREDAEDCE